MEVTTVGSAGTGGAPFYRMCVYSDVDGYPGALLIDSGAVIDATSATWQSTTLATAVTLPPSLYWWAVVLQGNPQTVPNVRCVNNGDPVDSSGTPASNNVYTGLYQASVTSTPPNPFVVGGSTGTIPRVWYKG